MSHTAAAQTAAEMSTPPEADERLSLFLVGVFARCIPMAEKDPTLSAEKRQALSDAYGDQAIGLLRASIQRGSGLLWTS